MKASTLKTLITKSVNALHNNALSLAINDDSVKESTLMNYATIEHALQGLAASLSDEQIQWMLENVQFEWKQISELRDAQSREFYKRLKYHVIFATTGKMQEKTIRSLALETKQGAGKKDKYTYQRIQSIFGHQTITQPSYFATFLELTNSGTKKTPSKGNEIRVDWDAPLMQNY